MRLRGTIDLGRRIEVVARHPVGSGDVDMEKVEALQVSINIVGSGSAVVSVIEELDVNIMGSGDVLYSGKPEVSQSVLGSGDVERQ